MKTLSKLVGMLILFGLNNGVIAENYGRDSHVGNQYKQLVSVPESCGFLRGKGLIVARSGRYDIIYAYDNTVTKDCCLAKVPIGESSSEMIVKKACIHKGKTGWSVNVSPNHYMDPMKIYLPGHPKELDAYYAGLRLITN